jgi:hypothetical protein
MDPGFDDGLFNATTLEAAQRSIQTGQAELIKPAIAEALA